MVRSSLASSVRNVTNLIFGEYTVNVAARMAGIGRAGCVTLTRDVRHLISDQFNGEVLGELKVPGKGLDFFSRDTPWLLSRVQSKW